MKRTCSSLTPIPKWSRINALSGGGFMSISSDRQPHLAGTEVAVTSLSIVKVSLAAVGMLSISLILMLLA